MTGHTLANTAKKFWSWWKVFIRALAPSPFDYVYSQLKNENLVVLLGSVLFLSVVLLIAAIFEAILGSLFPFLLFCILFGVLYWIFTGKLFE